VFREQRNTPKSSAGAYSVPETPQLEEVAVVWLAATLPKNSISRSQPCGPRTFGPKRDAHAPLFRRRSSYVIAYPSVCLSSIVCRLWRCCTLLTGL